MVFFVLNWKLLPCRKKTKKQIGENKIRRFGIQDSWFDLMSTLLVCIYFSKSEQIEFDEILTLLQNFQFSWQFTRARTMAKSLKVALSQKRPEDFYFSKLNIPNHLLPISCFNLLQGLFYSCMWNGRIRFVPLLV